MQVGELPGSPIIRIQYVHHCGAGLTPSWGTEILKASAAAAAAKSLQSCPTLCDPMDSSPPGSSVHRIL